MSRPIIERYLSESAMGCFARVKPSESRKTLTDVSRDLFNLHAQFKDHSDVTGMYSFKDLARVLHEQCNLTDVEVVAPVMGGPEKEGFGLADFRMDESGRVSACPLGYPPVKSKKKKRHSVGFEALICEVCPERSRCPVTKGQKFYYLRFTEKDRRLAIRRRYEQTEAFKDRYRWRAGVEAVMSEYDRRTGVKHLRVRSFKAVKYSATLKALAVNIFRAAAIRATRMMSDPELCPV